MEWRSDVWSVCLPLLIFPCTIKSRSSLLAPVHPGGPGKRAVKRLWCGGDNNNCIHRQPAYTEQRPHLTSPVVDPQTIRPDKWLWSVLCVSVGAIVTLLVEWRERHPACKRSVPPKLIPKEFSSRRAGKEHRGPPGKWPLMERRWKRNVSGITNGTAEY